MVVKGVFVKGFGGFFNMGVDFDDNWGVEGEVGDEVVVFEGEVLVIWMSVRCNSVWFIWY